MPLMEHLRELRSRLVKSILAIAVGFTVAIVLYMPILDWLTEPFNAVRPTLEAKGINTNLVMSGIGGAFQFQIKVSLIAGILFASPVWIWQMWAFVLPALHRHEKRAAIILTSMCVPLFVGGAWVGYLTFPKAIELLIGLVPTGWESLLTGSDYLTFVMRMMLLFGIGAQIPVVVVALNRMGAVSARQLARSRPWIIVGIFIFAAIATPTVDPITFLFLAFPMSAMYLVAEVIAHVTDRRRARAADDTPDDVASSLPPVEPLDE